MKWLILILGTLASFDSALAKEALLGAEGNDRCGIGTMIMGNKQSISSETLEISSNAFFLNESFSMTTGTSGCSHSGIVQVDQRAVIYANANFEELKVEMASGQGETLEAFAVVMGCSGDDVSLFMSASKQQYSKIYTAPVMGPQQMLINLREGMKQVPQLTHNCSSLNS